MTITDVTVIIKTQKDYQADGCPIVKVKKDLTAQFGRQGGYFFFVISITSAIIATKRVPKRKSSSYVTIGTTLLSKRAKSVPSQKRDNRLPL